MRVRSGLSDMQRSNLRRHLPGRQIAGNISIEDSSGFLGPLKAFKSHGSYRAHDASLALHSFLVRNLSLSELFGTKVSALFGIGGLRPRPNLCVPDSRQACL